MAQNEEIQKVKDRIKKKYDYLSDEDVDTAFGTALADYVRYSYPFSGNRPTFENIVYDFYMLQWIYERMEDLLSRAGGTNVTSYKENGLAWTYASSGIDPTLIAKIIPHGSVPR